MQEAAPKMEAPSREPAQEHALEILEHLDVSKVMREKNAYFVHMVQVTEPTQEGALDVSENNKSGIDTRRLSNADKLDIVYGTNPSLSASTLRPHTNDGTFYGGFGVIFSHGEIESAHMGDTGSTALSRTERHVIGGFKNETDDVEAAIERNHNDSKSYNEIVLKNPEVAGGFMKIGGYQDRISYGEEESTYYDGEKRVTKVGILDMANKFDRAGRVVSGTDKPFSVLLEMYKRGKTFVMDEANQMYIIRNIDEQARKVEFIAVPIDPNQFADAYGKEKMNPYYKKEITERLDRSLKEKGMELH
jgi:hypothetical protein